MSASKKKRMGSQRRSLNPNAQESSQTTDKATDPSLLPQGRERSDANADISLSPDRADTSGRKKKLGSQRGNKGKSPFKDVSTESSHKPKEEAEDSSTQSQPLDTLDINTETILERNVESLFPESSDLVLDDTPNASSSIKTEVVLPNVVIQNTIMDRKSDLPLKDGSEKYLAEIDSTEEGVFSEKGLTEGVPDIFGGTIPAGVTEESTGPVRPTQNEIINLLGSHDDSYKQNTEDKAGPMDKPVNQDVDKSALPTAKPRKMGSSRRKGRVNLEQLKETGNEMAEESTLLAFNALETNLSNVENAQEVNVTATEVTNKEESQEEMNVSPKVNIGDIDSVSEVDDINLQETSPFENVLVDLETKDDQIEVASQGNEQLAFLQNNDLSEISLERADGENVNTEDQPKQKFDDVTIVYGQATSKDDQNEGLNHTDEIKESILEVQDAKTLMNIEDQADGQHEMDITPIQIPNMPMESVGDTTEPSSLSTDSQLPPKEQINVNQLFFSSDHEDLKYTAKSTSEDDQNEGLNLTDERLEDTFDRSLEISPSASGAQISAPLDVSVNDEMEVSNDSLLYHDESPTAEEPISEKVTLDFDIINLNSGSVSVSEDNSGFSSEGISSPKDETVKTNVDSPEKRKPDVEEVLHLNPDEGLILSSTTESDFAQSLDAQETTTSTESKTPKDNEINLMFDSTMEVKNDNTLGQDFEPLISFTESYKEDQAEATLINISSEPATVVDIFSETEMLSHPHTAEINVSLTSPSHDLTSSWSVQDETVEVISTSPTEEIKDESTLEVWDPKTFMNIEDQADGQHEMDITPIQIQNMSMESVGDTTELSSVSTEHPKEQIYVNQLFFSSDHEDLKYTAKPLDESGIEETEVITDTLLTTESPVTNETAGESENMQRLDVQVNTPDTDHQHGPVKRKMSSSRRLKAKNNDMDIAVVYKDGALNTENENLLSSIDVQTDTRSEPIKEEGNIEAHNEVDAEVREQIPLNDKVELDQMKEQMIVEANILDIDDAKVDDESNQQCTSNKCVISEVDEDGDQRENTTAVQMPHTGDSTQQDSSAEDSQLIVNKRKLGSSRRIKGRRQDKDEQKPKEVSTKPESVVDDENQETVQDEFTQVHTETLEAVDDESSKPQEVTSLFGVEHIPEDAKLNTTDSQVVDSEILKETGEELPKPDNEIDQRDANIDSYAFKQTMNVHQLTYISDSETHEEIDDSSLQEADQQVMEKTTETPENSALIDIEVNTVDSDTQNVLRRKLGSSRRKLGKNLKDKEETNQVPELVEASPIEDISTHSVTEVDTEQINLGIFTKSDDETKKDTGSLLESDPNLDSTQEKVSQTKAVLFEENTIPEIQKEIPGDKVDNISLVEPKILPPDVVNTTSSNIAAPEEIIDAKNDDAVKSFGMSTTDITKEQIVIDGIEVSESSQEKQMKPEPKRKMGSTRRSQLNRKQQDEEIDAEASATMVLKKDESPNVSKDAQMLPSNIFENQENATMSAGLIKNQAVNEDITGGQDSTQGDKGKMLQTQTQMVDDLDKDATIQTLKPISGEEIPPSSPGKRRKMGSTRKNLSSKRESPEVESVTPEYSEKKEVASNSNDKGSKENSGLLVYTAAVHQPPADEDTPLSQAVLPLESKEAELSSQHEMSEDAAVARRRKMGSHRKPHSEQSIREQSVTDGQSLLQPLKEKPPKLANISEVNVGDNKASASGTAFNVKLNPRPVSENISQQRSLQPTNVRRVQESNIRISTGLDRSASRYEVVMIGDSSVGKTSFIQRAQSGKFSLDVPASIGMDSYKWTVAVNGKTIVLHLWDTAGQERFRSMTRQIFHRAQAFLLMYDVTCAQTFAAVSYWANCIKDGAAENAVVLLLGNKCDHMDRKVRREDGEILAEENNFAFMECSAATGENVIEALETVARMLSQKADRIEEPLLLRKPEPKNKLGCC